MRMSKYGRELELLLLLTDNGNYTAQELAERLKISRRNLYYYLEYLRFSGFHIVKTGTHYSIDRHSPFFRRLHENISLTENEAIYLHRLLDNGEKKDFTSQVIIAKLERFYHLGNLSNPDMKKQMNRNIAVIKQAMAQKTMVVLKHYSSPHSHSVADRIVEPYLLLNEGADVRCYEVASHMNKTFKASRMKSVEIIDVPWIFEEQHRELFTDIFGFSGEERTAIRLRMGQLSHNIMLEEHPDAEPYFSKEDDTHWILDMDVVSMRGIGRFVMGLFADIEVLGGDDFAAYMAEQRSLFLQKER